MSCKSLATLLIAVAGIGAMSLQPAGAAPTDDARSAIVIVEVKGTSANSAPVEVHGTGFFIDRDGYLLTSYHLLSELTDQRVDPDAIHYDIKLGALGAAPIDAAFIWSSPPTDLLILFVPLADQRLTTLKPADRNLADIEAAQTKVYTAGYPEGYGYTPDEGIIKSVVGPISPVIPTWLTSLNFKEGQSGSPVMLEDGRVVAVVKGNDADAASLGLVVPIRSVPTNFWDGSLPVIPSGDAGNLPHVVVSAESAEVAPRNRQLAFQVSNMPCDGDRHQLKTIKNTPGWRIVGPVSDPTLVSATGATARAQIASQNENKFVVDVELENSGSCSQVFGVTITTDTPATYSGVVNYLEAPLPTNNAGTISEAAAIHNVKLPIPVSDGKISFKLVTSRGEEIPFVVRRGEISDHYGQQALDVGKIAARVEKENR